MIKKTKMVCTIGPKSEKREVMESLLNSGMNVMRLNFSHGDFAEHGGRIDNIEKIMAETGRIFAVLLDTRGPEIRTCSLEGGQDIQLVTGQKITITTDSSFVGNRDKISVTYANLAKDLKVGDTVLLDDGLIALKVLATTDTEVSCEVLNNGLLGEKKGVNLPNTHITMPFLSEHDKNDILFGIKRNVDFIAASFTRNRQDVLDIRNFLNENGGQEIKIIAKIENQEGLDNFEDILEVADGIMVARGDLGVEIPAQEVIFAQKKIIKRCNEIGKIVITATQMLESMTKSPVPSRAEASDVANAVFDGTDLVMMSAETASGDYPVESVKAMVSIVEAAEKSVNKTSHDNMTYLDSGVNDALADSASYLSYSLDNKAIIALSRSGRTVRNLSKKRPKTPIVFMSADSNLCNGLAICHNVYTIHMPEDLNFSAGINHGGEINILEDTLVEHKLAEHGDRIIVVSGSKWQGRWQENSVRIVVMH